MEDDDPDDLYGSQEVAEESEDRPPLKVVDLTAETEVPMDWVEEAPAPENMVPLPVCKPLREIDPSAGHRVSGQRCIHSLWELCRRYPLFPQFLPIYCKTSCPKHDVKLHNYALTITTTTCGTCLWSRYPVLVIICELEDSTSRPSVASWRP